MRRAPILLIFHWIVLFGMEKNSNLDLNNRFFKACQTHNVTQIKNILMKGADVFATDDHHNNCLHLVTKASIAKKLINYINQQTQSSMSLENMLCSLNKAGKSPLHVAVEAHNYNLVELLLQNSAQPNHENNMGMASLHILAQQIKLHLGHNDFSREVSDFISTLRCTNLLQLLVDYKADINKKDDIERTPLGIIITRHNIRFGMLEDLLSLGADFQQKFLVDNVYISYLKSFYDQHGIEPFKKLFVNVELPFNQSVLNKFSTSNTNQSDIAQNNTNIETPKIEQEASMNSTIDSLQGLCFQKIICLLFYKSDYLCKKLNEKKEIIKNIKNKLSAQIYPLLTLVPEGIKARYIHKAYLPSLYKLLLESQKKSIKLKENSLALKRKSSKLKEKSKKIFISTNQINTLMSELIKAKHRILFTSWKAMISEIDLETNQLSVHSNELIKVLEGTLTPETLATQCEFLDQFQT